MLINIKLCLEEGFASNVLLYKTRRKIDDAFRGNINGRLKHHLYRKVDSLNERHEIYFHQEKEGGERSSN